jgi:CHAT domain-containing protein
MDFAASREAVLSGFLHRFRFIHFATHAVLDTAYPELSGLVLSLVDREGRPQNGFLRAHEISDLDLAADLVVLSACRTALGEEIRGEGLVGLTRAFVEAGAERVLVSLWQVDDRATAEIMRHMYREMVQEGLPPAAALRRSQLTLWRETDWRAPYYWAGFVVQGDWR